MKLHSNPGLILSIALLQSVLLQLPSFAGTITPFSLAPAAPDRDPISFTGDADEYSQDSDYDLHWIHRQLDRAIVGFSFENKGGNAILPQKDAGMGEGPNRTWEFHFTDRARQEIQLNVVDAYNGTPSQYMNTSIYFFPRKVLPGIAVMTNGLEGVNSKNYFEVTLPTGEKVFFNAETKETLQGDQSVLQETGVLDASLDRSKRKFAQLKYSGKGITVRADRQGEDPHRGTVATIQQGKNQCKVPVAQLWDQSQSRFLFATDSEFQDFLKKACKTVFIFDLN